MGMLWKVNESEIKLRNKQLPPKQVAGPHPTKKLVRMVGTCNSYYSGTDTDGYWATLSVYYQKYACQRKYNLLYRKHEEPWDLARLAVLIRTSCLPQ